jgi:hypothetical protein
VIAKGLPMKTTISSVILALVLLSTISAQETSSGDQDGYMLRKDLQAMDRPGYSVTETQNFAFAFGYVIGVSEAFDTIRFCLPESPRQGELREVVIKYLNDHPEQLHRARFAVTADALEAAFPCPSPGPRLMIVPRPTPKKP